MKELLRTLQISVHSSISAELTDFFTSPKSSWGRVENPKKVFTVGETLKVLIKEINGDKIALSLKFPEAKSMAHSS